jgi:hypothetical protein
MDRISLIQYLINKYKFSTFLEIGSQLGLSFFPIICNKKISVDPFFQFGVIDKIRWSIKNFTNINNAYFEMTSNDFFTSKEEYLNDLGGIDIVFVDGLHTFRAALQDTLNSLRHLRKDGVVVLHDCFPPHEAASVYAKDADEAREIGRNLESWTGEWCGDTWKAMAYLKKKYYLSLDTSVLNFDYGLGIVKVKHKLDDLEIDESLFTEIDNLSYEDLLLDPEELIGLVEGKYYIEI